jgi:hypothetical protein
MSAVHLLKENGVHPHLNVLFLAILFCCLFVIVFQQQIGVAECHDKHAGKKWL